jgi:hypothetical protein
VGGNKKKALKICSGPLCPHRLTFRAQAPSDPKDLVSNAVWIEPVVKQFPDRVPSAYMLGDMFLMLDGDYNNLLLRDCLNLYIES